MDARAGDFDCVDGVQMMLFLLTFHLIVLYPALLDTFSTAAEVGLESIEYVIICKSFYVIY